MDLLCKMRLRYKVWKAILHFLRQNIWSPQHLANVEGLPIYYANAAEAAHYAAQWSGLIERAQALYQPLMQDEVVDAIHLPSHLNLPLFFFHVDRIRINKTPAKESKTFAELPVWLKNVVNLSQMKSARCNIG